MKDINEEPRLTASNAEDLVLPASKPAGLPTRPSDPTAHLRTGKGGSCMPPVASPARASGAEPQLASMFPIKGDIDLLGESEDYTTQDDGSRLFSSASLLKNSEKAAYIAAEEALAEEKARDNQDTTAKQIKQVELELKYGSYVDEVTETNRLRANRIRWAKPMLIISLVIASALVVTLRVMGGL